VLSTGDILEGKYAIGPVLGAGGMGVVYQGEHLSLGMKVAIKVLHPSEADDPTMIARFKAEARSAAAIRHQNVVEVTDFGLTPDRRPFFVMAHLKGESLADRLDRCRTLSERETVEIVDQILQGLSVAHRRGVVHRDLKPENVFLARGDDGREIVKLLDFGIAKILGGSQTHKGKRAESGRQLTMKGMVLGTPGYMAPETIEADVPIDARADLFAVGVLMYEMLAGRLPFSGGSPLEIMSNTISKPVPRPSALRSDISDAMERLILTALARDPLDRFQNTDEFEHHLTAAAVGRIPDDARPCRTRVGLPSVAPESAPSVRPAAGRHPDATTAPLGSRRARADKPASSGRPSGSRSVAAPVARPLRRSSPIVISPLLILFLLALGGAAYYLFVYEKPFKIVEHESRTGNAPGARRETPPPPSATDAESSPETGSTLNADLSPTVTIWIEVTPPDAVILWGDEPQTDRPLIVARGDTASVLSVSSPGYESQELRITPDSEQTVRIRLKPKARKGKGRRDR